MDFQDLQPDQDPIRRMQRIIDAVADALGSRLGPGKAIAGSIHHAAPQSDNINIPGLSFQDPLDNLGLRLLNETVASTRRLYGDGSSTAAVLAHSMMSAGLKGIAHGANPALIRQGIQMASRAVAQSVSAQALQFGTREEIAALAALSLTDQEIGGRIADVLDHIGPYGALRVEIGEGHTLAVEYAQGMKLNGGYLSPYFITDPVRREAVIDEPAILLHEDKLTRADEIVPVLEMLNQVGVRSVVVLAEIIYDEVLSALVLNNLRGRLYVLAVKNSLTGDLQRQELGDLAAISGATVIRKSELPLPGMIEAKHLGRVGSVSATKTETMFHKGGGSPVQIQARIASIEARIQTVNEETRAEERLEERLSRLRGGSAVMRVGKGALPSRPMDRQQIENAISTVRLAIAEGVVPGGGVALMNAMTSLEGISSPDASIDLGIQLVRQALDAPLILIAKNAGKQGEQIVSSVRQLQTEQGNPNLGYDVGQDRVVDMVELGVLDPAAVTRGALDSAARITAQFLHQSAAWVQQDDAEDQLDEPEPPPSDMIEERIDLRRIVGGERSGDQPRPPSRGMESENSGDPGLDFDALEPDFATAEPDFILNQQIDAMARDSGQAANKRYANALLVGPDGDTPLVKDRPLTRSSIFRLRLDIGELSSASAVLDPQAIREDLLPDEDLWLDVVVSSTQFELALDRAGLQSQINTHGSAEGDGTVSIPELTQSRLVSSKFFLPADKNRFATTPEGQQYLYIWVKAPYQPGAARLRIGYYFRNSLVQGQILTADVGWVLGKYQVKVDYTLSSSLSGLGKIPERKTLSLITNDNGDGTHQIVLRSGDDDLPLDAVTYELDEKVVGNLVGEIRKALKSEGVAPTAKQRSKRRLISDLKKLAPLGWKLWNGVLSNIVRLYSVLDEHQDLVIQVHRPTGKSYTFPWGMIYDIYLEEDADWEVCPMVESWDEDLALFDGAPHRCPKVDEVDHTQNLLCPFGFWANRYSIEQLASTDTEAFAILEKEPELFEIAVGETQYNVDKKALQEHISGLEKLTRERFPGAQVHQGQDKQSIRSLLGKDWPLIYFYCHGERPRPGDPNTYLGVGRREAITASDFRGWLMHWFRRERKTVWKDVRPLIFINACHSLEINPDTLTSYLDTFVGEAHAAGVIGTEVKVSQKLAREMADGFFRNFLVEGQTVENALHNMRMEFLAAGNLFGLLYTSYCRSDLVLLA
jgi:chaperonin GroEL